MQSVRWATERQTCICPILAKTSPTLFFTFSNCSCPERRGIGVWAGSTGGLGGVGRCGRFGRFGRFGRLGRFGRCGRLLRADLSRVFSSALEQVPSFKMVALLRTTKRKFHACGSNYNKTNISVKLRTEVELIPTIAPMEKYL